MREWPHEWRAGTPGALCPRCGTPTGRPILYGLPGPDVFEAERAGEIDIELGGCMVMGEDPRFRCRTCGLAFGRPPGRPPRSEDAEPA
jgi:hypothetical protein